MATNFLKSHSKQAIIPAVKEVRTENKIKNHDKK